MCETNWAILCALWLMLCIFLPRLVWRQGPWSRCFLMVSFPNGRRVLDTWPDDTEWGLNEEDAKGMAKEAWFQDLRPLETWDQFFSVTGAVLEKFHLRGLVIILLAMIFFADVLVGGWLLIVVALHPACCVTPLKSCQGSASECGESLAGKTFDPNTKKPDELPSRTTTVAGAQNFQISCATESSFRAWCKCWCKATSPDETSHYASSIVGDIS